MSLLRVRESFSIDTPSEGIVILRRGDLFPMDHPFVKGRESLFEPAETAAAQMPGGAHTVETAAAPPGERRTISVPPRRAPSKE
jgi:hypothetical protein